MYETEKNGAPTGCEMAISSGMLRHESYIQDTVINLYDTHTEPVKHVGKC